MGARSVGRDFVILQRIRILSLTNKRPGTHGLASAAGNEVKK